MDSDNSLELCCIKICALFVANTRSVRKTTVCHHWEKLWDEQPGKTSYRKWFPMNLEWNAMGCKVKKNTFGLYKGWIVPKDLGSLLWQQALSDEPSERCLNGACVCPLMIQNFRLLPMTNRSSPCQYSHWNSVRWVKRESKNPHLK